jgi:predicted nucleotidyltransferase
MVLKNQTINLAVIEKVAVALQELNKDMVYVGGAVVGLYVTDEGAEQPRPTKDIDISVQINSYSQMDQLREALATKKIYPAEQEDVIYRYKYEDVLIDFIPSEKTPLGPTNSWLKVGFSKSLTIPIGKALIRILPVSLYLATKWEAFKGRGNDARTSPDFEDIVYVLDNNLHLVSEVANADKEIQFYLRKMSLEILSHPSRNEIIECHINPFTAEERSTIVLGKLEEIVLLTND